MLKTNHVLAEIASRKANSRNDRLATIFKKVKHVFTENNGVKDTAQFWGVSFTFFVG
jgi:hypothetical protein